MAVSESSFRLLQVIALTLPAIALYMNVLTQIYMKATEVEWPHRGTAAIELGASVSMRRSRKDNGDEESSRKYGTKLTTAVDHWDFTLSALSLLVLLLNGAILILASVYSHRLLYLAGSHGTALGYLLLVAGVAITIKTTVTESAKSLFGGGFQ